MSLALPLAGTAVRELFDVRTLVEMTLPQNRAKLATFRSAVLSAKRYIAENAGARSVHSICLRANGELWLIKVGARGGWSKVWNFGTL